MEHVSSKRTKPCGSAEYTMNKLHWSKSITVRPIKQNNLGNKLHMDQLSNRTIEQWNLAVSSEENVKNEIKNELSMKEVCQ